MVGSTVVRPVSGSTRAYRSSSVNREPSSRTYLRSCTRSSSRRDRVPGAVEPGRMGARRHGSLRAPRSSRRGALPPVRRAGFRGSSHRPPGRSGRTAKEPKPPKPPGRHRATAGPSGTPGCRSPRNRWSRSSRRRTHRRATGTGRDPGVCSAGHRRGAELRAGRARLRGLFRRAGRMADRRPGGGRCRSPAGAQRTSDLLSRGRRGAAGFLRAPVVPESASLVVQVGGVGVVTLQVLRRLLVVGRDRLLGVGVPE